MERYKSIVIHMFFLIALLVRLIVVPTCMAEEVQFSIDRVDINGQIQANGLLHMEEKYEYQVDYINGAYIDIEYVQGSVTNYTISVLDKETNKFKKLEESYSGEPKTYQVNDNGTKVNFKIFYPAQDETVVFKVDYMLEGAITNYNDTAYLNRKIVGRGIDDTINVDAVIQLPGKVEDKKDFRAWGHGAPQGDIQLENKDGQDAIHLKVDRNPPHQFVEISSIFPTSLTPNNTRYIQENKKDTIIKSEIEQVEKDKKLYQRKQMEQFIFSVFCSLTPLVIVIYTYYYYFTQRKRLNPSPVHVPEHIYHIPENITPAVMATSVFRKHANADDFSATIMDLARKGYLKVEEVERKKRGILNRSGESTILISPVMNAPDISVLEKHERYVLDYVLPNGKESQPQTLLDIEEEIKKSKTIQKEQYNRWTGFINFTEVKGNQLRGEAPEYMRSIGWAIISLGGSILGLIAVIILGLSIHVYENIKLLLILMSIVSIIMSIVILVLTTVRPIKTQEQDQREKEWKSFSNMLKNIGQIQLRSVASLPLWEEFLVYAISLGIADKVLEAMNKTYSVEELESLSMPIEFYTNPYLMTHVVRNSIASSTAASAPPMSSGKYTGSNTGGFGGGFSGGSSGGFGGGSGAGGF